MKAHWLVGAVLVVLTLCGVCRALDMVKTTKGATAGRIVRITPLQIDIQQGSTSNVSKEIPVNQILTIFYDDEPTELKAAKRICLPAATARLWRPWSESRKTIPGRKSGKTSSFTRPSAPPEWRWQEMAGSQRPPK